MIDLVCLYDVVEDQVRDSAFWGGPEDVMEQVDRWTDAGVNHFILTTPRPFNRAMLERLMKDVVPSFS